MPIIKSKPSLFKRPLLMLGAIGALLLYRPLINAQEIEQDASAQGASAQGASAQRAWQQTLNEARGENVYFYAWGGDPQVNRYLQWLADQVDNKYGVNLEHVKLAQTSNAVSRVLAEVSAGNMSEGQVDLLWINGLNFATMAENNLLEAKWVSLLPNFALTNPQQNPAMTMDFGVPTNGMEAPWGRAALTFYYDSAYHNGASSSPPSSLQELLHWSMQNPGRFTYSKPPDFLGLSFLKYALIILNQQQDPEIFAKLYKPPIAESERELLASLWVFLDQLHPYLWRQGRYFVSDGASIRRLVGDNELQLGFTFSASDIPGAVERFGLPPSIRSFAMKDGSLSNVHFVTIPVNAKHKAAAKVVANFLMSVEAQAKKQQPSEWGDRTVLDLSLLAPDQQLMFRSPNQHPSALPGSAKSPSLSEPHPQWNAVLTEAWERRYGAKRW